MGPNSKVLPKRPRPARDSGWRRRPRPLRSWWCIGSPNPARLAAPRWHGACAPTDAGTLPRVPPRIGVQAPRHRCRRSDAGAQGPWPPTPVALKLGGPCVGLLDPATASRRLLRSDAGTLPRVPPRVQTQSPCRRVRASPPVARASPNPRAPTLRGFPGRTASGVSSPAMGRPPARGRVAGRTGLGRTASTHPGRCPLRVPTCPFMTRAS